MSQRRNLIPLILIVVLAIVGIGLLTRAATRRNRPAPDPMLAHLMISSSRPGTSLFGNDRYLGEIGPQPREFAVLPGPLHLRLVRSYCRASDTSLDLKFGEHLTVGPLDPVCGRP